MNEEEGAALALLSRMRFACGDNGKRMQDDLEDYLRGLRKDAERYRRLRKSALEVAWCEQVSFSPGYSENGPAELDAEIDRQMNGANA